MSTPDAKPARRRSLLPIFLVSVPLLAAPAVLRTAVYQAQAPLTGEDAPPGAIWLDSLDLSRMVQRRGTPRAGRSGAGRGNNPPPLSLGGVTYRHGIGTLSINELIVDLKGQATRFEAMIGIDDAARTGQGSVTYEIWLDNRRAFTSGIIKAGDPPQRVSVDLSGARFMELFIDDGSDVSTRDYADWAGAVIHLRPGATETPESWTFPSEPPPPIASGWPDAPRINPPRITGGTPGRPFRFRIPATGREPLTFTATGLPDGLSLDSQTGIITGSIARGPLRRVDRSAQRDRLRDISADDRRWRGCACPHTAARLELVERLGRLGGRREGARGGRCDGFERPGGARVSVHQHRRWLGRGARRERRVAAEREVPRHEGARRLRACERPEDRHLLVPRSAHLPGLAGQLPARGDRCAHVGELGLRPAEARLVLVRVHREGRQSRRAAEAVYRHARCAEEGRPRHRLQPVPVRHGQRVGVGRRCRRQLLAHERRSHRRLVEHVVGRLPAGRTREVVPSRTLDRSRHARRRKGGLGAEHPRHAAHAERTRSRTPRCGRFRRRRC